MIKCIKKLSPANKFLLGMILVYAFISTFNSSYIKDALTGSLEDFVKLVPLFVFVYIIIFFINLYLKPESIQRHLSQEAGMKGWIYALLASIFLTVPPYIAFPMLSELKKHGMSHALIAVFMNNRHVQPALLAAMVYYFGLKFTVVISIYILIFAIITGIIIGKILDKDIN